MKTNLEFTHGNKTKQKFSGNITTELGKEHNTLATDIVACKI